MHPSKGLKSSISPVTKSLPLPTTSTFKKYLGGFFIYFFPKSLVDWSYFVYSWHVYTQKAAVHVLPDSCLGNLEHRGQAALYG